RPRYAGSSYTWVTCATTARRPGDNFVALGPRPLRLREIDSAVTQVLRLQPRCYAWPRSFAGMAIDLRRKHGERGEKLAEAHLENRGYRILARNYRTRF